ncbi:MAG: ORF6N domain-containing protein [Cyclobacteriaceae bacterium]
MQVIQSIQNRIYEIRGERVMLDLDLANLFEVKPAFLILSAKINSEWFLEDFMFRLHPFEYEIIKHNVKALQPHTPIQVTLIDTIPFNDTDNALPYAFTKAGVMMLNEVLHSSFKMNKADLTKSLEDIRGILSMQGKLKGQLKEIKKRLSQHGTQPNEIYDALENLIDEKASKRKWDARDRIGFSKE